MSGNAAAIPAFQKQFGEPHPTATGQYLIPAYMLTAWGSASCAGDLVGILFAGWLIDAVGRKHTLAVGSVLTAAGVAMQVASHEWLLFLAGRVVNGEFDCLHAPPPSSDLKSCRLRYRLH